ncbi:hypothetical protein GCM10029976_047350 [Kribbella albertanoniae]|uniref:Uncharacterized protein n=1 Tax=Kribbella albertanoniae TaxID=1266829 RepID=A0A4R4P9G0_9ACTN|nr:hypothetical protein [Kribbella albertanoniae]TDC17583.1 hypothetical protein E1261_36855 [Kribbella albertanoniae]
MRKTFLAAGAAALAVAATGAVLVARPSSAALSDVPKDCQVSTAAYRSDLQRLTYTYNGGFAGTKAYAGDKLGWVPTAHQQIGGAGDDTVFRSTEFAAHPTDGYLYRVSRRGELVDGAWRVPEVTATRLKSGFGSTRILAYSYPYLYRVTGSALYRYTVDSATGVPSAPVRLATTGWSAVNTLVSERTAGTGTAKADVLIGTNDAGQLKEWTINHATPTRITSKVLRSIGWEPFTSLSTGFCADHPAGRPLLAITATGRASVHFDANKTDGLGTDIKGGSLGELGWTARAYGQ